MTLTLTISNTDGTDETDYRSGVGVLQLSLCSAEKGEGEQLIHC